MPAFPPSSRRVPAVDVVQNLGVLRNRQAAWYAVPHSLRPHLVQPYVSEGQVAGDTQSQTWIRHMQMEPSDELADEQYAKLESLCARAEALEKECLRMGKREFLMEMGILMRAFAQICLEIPQQGQRMSDNKARELITSMNALIARNGGIN